jgi:hypothetical protein
VRKRVQLQEFTAVIKNFCDVQRGTQTITHTLPVPPCQSFRWTAQEMMEVTVGEKVGRCRSDGENL